MFLCNLVKYSEFIPFKNFYLIPVLIRILNTINFFFLISKLFRCSIDECCQIVLLWHYKYAIVVTLEYICYCSLYAKKKKPKSAFLNLKWNTESISMISHYDKHSETIISNLMGSKINFKITKVMLICMHGTVSGSCEVLYSHLDQV